MRIGLFTDSYLQLNGVSRHVHNIACALARRGHEVKVITSRGCSEHYQVVNMPYLPFPLETHYDIVLPNRSNFDIDIAHSHTPWLCGWWGLLFSGVPTVTTTHTAPQQIFSMYKANFLDSIGWQFLISFHNHSDHVICQSKCTEKEFKKHGLDRPVTIASASIDTKTFEKGNASKFIKKYNLPKEFVLCTTRISQEKRPELIVKACKELGYPVVFTAEGPLMNELKKSYKDAVFLGHIPYEDIPSAYHAAKVFVSASAFETEGLVVPEALAAGAPVVSSSIPTMCEIIKDGQDGFLFRDYPELKKKLKILWEDPGLRKKFSKNGKKAAKDKDIEVVADRLERVYESLTSKP
jgi:1,2-diacylglycerol 3-alpha-glucosyltransferase